MRFRSSSSPPTPLQPFRTNWTTSWRSESPKPTESCAQSRFSKRRWETTSSLAICLGWVPRRSISTPSKRTTRTSSTTSWSGWRRCWRRRRVIFVIKMMSSDRMIMMKFILLLKESVMCSSETNSEIGLKRRRSERWISAATLERSVCFINAIDQLLLLLAITVRALGWIGQIITSFFRFTKI